MNKLCKNIANDTREHLIIVADGDEKSNERICEKLKKSSFSVCTALNGKKTLALIQKNPEALLLLNYKLPDMDGTDLLKKVKQLKLDLNFIIITASREEKKAASMLRHGAREYLIKEPGFLDIVPILVEKTLHEIEIEKQLVELREGLLQSEQKYNFIFENATTPMALLAKDGTFLLINSAFEKLCGYSKEQLEKNKNWEELALSGSVKKLKTPNGDSAKNTVSMKNYEFRMKSKSGIIKNIFLGVNSIAGNSWQIASFLDISSVRQTEKALQQSEQQFQNLIKNIPGIVYLCYYDEHWTMHYLVKEIENISGYPASDFINNNVRSYASIVHPDDVEIVNEAIRKGVDSSKPYEMEYRIIKKNGEIAWVYEKGQKVCTEDDTIWLNGIIFDITERKQLQLALDIATEEWRVTFDALPDAVLLSNRECEIVKCNKASEKLFGLSKDKIIGQRCFELIYGLDQPPKDSPYLKMLKSGRATSKIEHFNKKIVKITASPVIDSNGNIYGTVLLISDITKMKKTANKIKYKHKLLKSVFHTAPIGIGVIADRKLVKVNEEFCRITGYPPEELIGKDVMMFHDTKAEYDRVATYYEGLKKNQVATVHTRLKRKNGEMFEAMLRFSILETDIKGYTYTLTDITTMKSMLKQ